MTMRPLPWKHLFTARRDILFELPCAKSLGVPQVAGTCSSASTMPPVAGDTCVHTLEYADWQSGEGSRTGRWEDAAVFTGPSFSIKSKKYSLFHNLKLK